MIVPIVLLLLLKLTAGYLTAWDYLIGADMDRSVVLDDEGRVRIRWMLDRRNEAMDFVVFANCTGWVGLSISSAPLGTPGALGDIILAGYDDSTGRGYIEVSPVSSTRFQMTVSQSAG